MNVVSAFDVATTNLPPSISLGIETDLKKCKELWELLSPDENIADRWDYRAMWHAIEPLGQPYFIVARDQDKPIGLLPLAYFDQDHAYRWFGGGFWIERPRTFTHRKWRSSITPILYQAVPIGTQLLWTEPTEMNQMPIGMLSPQTPTYSIQMLSLKGNVNNIFQRMSSDSRKSIHRSIRKVIERFDPQIMEGTVENIKKLIELNIKRFGSDSTMHIQRLRDILPQMMTTPGVREFAHVVNIHIETRIVASTIILFYKGIYTYYQGGHDPDFPDLGKYHVYALLQDALQRGAKRFDALGDDCGWKERWRLDQAILWKYCI
jgi:hypothetical protein